MNPTEVLRKARDAIELQIRYHTAPFSYDRDAAMAKSHAAIVAIDAALSTPAAADGEPAKPNIDKLVDRFLSWPLPDSVCADGIATRPGPYHGGRSGTNLLTAHEARAMLEYVLAATPSAVASPSECDSLTGQEGEGA
jgi:hypothetical protein